MRAALRQPAAGQPGGRKGSSAAGVGKTAGTVLPLRTELLALASSVHTSFHSLPATLTQPNNPTTTKCPAAAAPSHAHRVAGVGVQGGLDDVHQVLRHLLAVHKQVGLEEPMAAKGAGRTDRRGEGLSVCPAGFLFANITAETERQPKNSDAPSWAGANTQAASTNSTATRSHQCQPAPAAVCMCCMPRSPRTGCAPSWTGQCRRAPHWWGRASAHRGTWWCSSPGPTRQTPGPSPEQGRGKAGAVSGAYVVCAGAGVAMPVRTTKPTGITFLHMVQTRGTVSLQPYPSSALSWWQQHSVAVPPC